MGRRLSEIGVGLVDGGVATLAMTGTMALEQRVGMLAKLPPDEVTERAVERAGASKAGDETTEEGRSTDVLAAALHLAFGMAAGAGFALLRTVALRPVARRVPGIVAGPLFAVAIWAASYAGWIPALGLLPPPSADDPRRPAAMLIAHLVFGAVLGLAGDLAEQVPSRAVGLEVDTDARKGFDRAIGGG